MYFFLLFLLCLCMAFFPAYLWHDPQLAWIGWLTTIVFALTTFLPFLKQHKKQWLIALIILSIFGYAIESLGVLSCFPYGCFSYSEQLGEKLFWLVPYLLVFTRPPLVIGVWSRLRSKGHAGRPLCLLGGLCLVAVDLVLDPIAVRMGMRSFTQTGRWFGIPRTNFAGWLLSGTVWVAILDHFLTQEQIQKAYLTGLFLFMSFFASWWLRTLLFTYFSF